MQHVFSAGNYGRVALERISNRDPFEAEISRARLRKLDLKPGDPVSVVFRHVRLFPKGGYTESDVEGDQLVSAAKIEPSPPQHRMRIP